MARPWKMSTAEGEGRHNAKEHQDTDMRGEVTSEGVLWPSHACWWHVDHRWTTWTSPPWIPHLQNDQQCKNGDFKILSIAAVCHAPIAEQNIRGDFLKLTRKQVINNQTECHRIEYNGTELPNQYKQGDPKNVFKFMWLLNVMGRKWWVSEVQSRGRQYSRTLERTKHRGHTMIQPPFTG